MARPKISLRRLFLFGLLFCVGVSGAADAAPRTLYWRALDVSAHLDRDGRLQVRERHTMVFDGAWNGGERRFRLGRGQRLELTGLARIDSVTGRPTPLRKGNLTAIDEYRWADRETLRWRSRLPSDPPLRGTELVYEIEYVLADILLVREAGYVLDHDFAFPDRPGPIQRFTLLFDWDPVWQTRAAFADPLTRHNLSPGQSVVVTVPLEYVGAGAPAGVTLPVAPRWRYLLLGLLIVFVIWRGLLWLRHEQALGRYARLVPVREIDESWLAEHVFMFAPEVVGAAWDKYTAEPEVAAVLARMTAEGKLAGEVRRKGFWLWRRSTLHLELLYDRRQFKGYERALIDALFFDGETTDTDSIRKHYRRHGFDPARKIRSALDQRIKRMAQRGERLLPPGARLTLTLGAGAVVLLVIGMVQQVFQDPLLAQIAATAAVIIVGLWAFSRVRALFYDSYIVHLARVSASLLAGAFALVAAVGYVLVTNTLDLNLWLLTGLTAFGAAACNSQFNGMRSRDSREFNQFRKHLAAGRRYFLRELQSSAPRLKDAWFPYLLAFGLGPDVDRWFRAHGGAGAQGGSFRANGGGSASASVSSGGWTGGGGSFGGAGASGSWAAAVGALAGGVVASSGSGSSGGGGGGGGGGSSGGGGGGGW